MYVDDIPVFSKFFIKEGRGNGKDGFIVPLVNFFQTPLYGVKNYHVEIVANSESQAKDTFKVAYDMLHDNQKFKGKFSVTKELITNLVTGSEMKYNTSNAKTKDGKRTGCLVLNEIHAYENYDQINVFESSLGKVKHSREFIITTDGYVRDGPLDEISAMCAEILETGEVLYGKNIVKDGFSETIDMTEVATRIIPKSYNGYMIAGDAPWIDSPLIEKYPTVHYKVMSFEDVKMRADASEDDETNGTIICDTQEQLEGALKKKCEEQYAAGVDKPKITIKADMELLQNTELYEDVKELEAVSLGDTVHCKHSKLRIVSDARVIELEWDAVRNKLISVTLGKFQYNFLNNVSSIMNRVEQAIRSDGSLIGQQVQGTINGVKAQLRAQSSIAKKQTVRAVLFEDLDPDSPTFGAMCLGTLGFEIASERTADGRDWKWSTFGTGQGFFADFIVAGTMLADRIKGGTLELGGAGNGNGVAKVLNADGNEIVRLDKDGVYAKGKYVCANTDGSQTATLSNGKLTFKTESYEVVIRAGAIGGLTGLMIYPEQGAVRTKFLSIGDKLSARFDNISLLASGKTTIGGASLEVQRDGKGYSGKTGKAVFSDGTYLEYVNGFLVGGNTKEGGF